jgi:hypothetical protein
MYGEKNDNGLGFTGPSKVYPPSSFQVKHKKKQVPSSGSIVHLNAICWQAWTGHKHKCCYSCQQTQKLKFSLMDSNNSNSFSVN